MSLFCLKPSGISPSHLDENPKSLLWSPRPYKSGPRPLVSSHPPCLLPFPPLKGTPITFLHSGPLPASSSAGGWTRHRPGTRQAWFDPASAAHWLCHLERFTSPLWTSIPHLPNRPYTCRAGQLPLDGSVAEVAESRSPRCETDTVSNSPAAQ